MKDLFVKYISSLTVCDMQSSSCCHRKFVLFSINVTGKTHVNSTIWKSVIFASFQLTLNKFALYMKHNMTFPQQFQVGVSIPGLDVTTCLTKFHKSYNIFPPFFTTLYNSSSGSSRLKVIFVHCKQSLYLKSLAVVIITLDSLS